MSNDSDNNLSQTDPGVGPKLLIPLAQVFRVNGAMWSEHNRLLTDKSSLIIPSCAFMPHHI